ncbi:hypothetical protein JMJ77_0012823, partial [Colletotrichum scovillei]
STGLAYARFEEVHLGIPSARDPRRRSV